MHKGEVVVLEKSEVRGVEPCFLEHRTLLDRVRRLTLAVRLVRRSVGPYHSMASDRPGTLFLHVGNGATHTDMTRGSIGLFPEFDGERRTSI